MKKLFKFLKSFNQTNKAGVSSQQKIIDFINDDENLKSAAKGSMQKRLDLIERVESRLNIV